MTSVVYNEMVSQRVVKGKCVCVCTCVLVSTHGEDADTVNQTEY